MAVAAQQRQIAAWPFTSRDTAIRLFITCWLVYSLHFATNTVREIYLALGIGDRLSFRVDEYAHMHPDLFEKEGYGWHIGNNPGASMLAAIPYALFRPVIDPIVKQVQQKRAAAGLTEAPSYDSPWPMQREFYKEAWRRGFDVKFGLAGFVMHALCMAPVSAAGIVVMFFALRRIFESDSTALWLSLLYAFGTPVFFRSGFLNQNMMLGHFAFMGFVTMWNAGEGRRWATRTRYFLGGLAGGTALLFDYSGAVLLLGLFVYGLLKRKGVGSLSDMLCHGGWYVLGTLGPIFLLWLYQWRSFGHPFYPGQHWMPPVEWSELGYQGYGWPQPQLFLALMFDHRFGLFVSSPLMLLAILCPLIQRDRLRLPTLELTTMLILFFALGLFFSGSNYTRLQFNTGIRYMAPILPFLFVPAAVVLVRAPRVFVYLLAVLVVTESWCLAMVREVERDLGVLDPILRVLIGGFQLPALTTISRLSSQYGEFFPHGVSPFPLFAMAAVLLYGLWSPRITGGSSTWARSVPVTEKEGAIL